MINIKNLLDDPNVILEKLKSRGYSLDVDLIKKLNTKRKDTITIKEKLSAEKNKISDAFKGQATDKAKAKLKEDSQTLEKEISSNKIALLDIESKLNDQLLQIPNIPDSGIPIGDENSNKVIKSWGSPTANNNNDHSALFEKNKLIDFESGVMLAKSRFTVMHSGLAKLHRSLISFMLDKHIANGYKEYYLPYLVNSESLIGTGQLPKFEEDLFKISGEDLYLIPTGEVPLTGLYKNSILSESELPIRMVSHTPCFRSEAGSYGKDTRGMIRQHQFDKIELVQIVMPSDSEQVLEDITSSAELILELLELPYQRVLLASEDIGFSAAKTFDIEVWMPSQSSYREVSSCSCFTDFQSRRLNIKYKDNNKNKIHPYTLNGSGLAVGRTLVALVENHTKDNIISIPKALQDYFGDDVLKL